MNKKVIYTLITLILLVTVISFVYIMRKGAGNKGTAQPQQSAVQQPEASPEKSAADAEVLKSLTEPDENAKSVDDAAVLKTLTEPETKTQSSTPVKTDAEVLKSLTE